MKIPKTNRKFTDAHRRNLSIAQKGRFVTEETRIKLSNAGKGRIFSDETKKKISIAHMGKKGIKLSQETKNKMSVAKKGSILSEESKKKLSISKMGHIVTDETRKKISLANMGKIPWNKGKTHSDKTKEILRLRRMEQVMPSKDSTPEKILQMALHLKGIVFEKHKAITGQPDIFIEPNICIFVDGDYWHANPEMYESDDIIIRNVKASEIWKKDIETNHKLTRDGYYVLRLWESEIKNNIDNCGKKIIDLIKGVKS